MTSSSAATDRDDTDDRVDARTLSAIPGAGRPTEKRHAWRAYFETTAALQDRLERSLRAGTGLHLADYNLLLLLAEAPGHRMRMGELAGRMVFSPSRLTYQVRTLQERGLVTRCAAPGDRRGAEAVLTDEGRHLFRRAAALHFRDVTDLVLDRIDDEEADVLLRVFSRLGDALGDRG
ncbi:MarR family winged helix-turn-helix transcriptional regulator [Tersicoccus phoenicis]|uniref:MarR family winged helix-turn-helix transcriptional regulator n=1 Tax=Tersicoccus phoenicis TaxID=554083 RepID=UPI000A024A74|nr:MarR family transcriptional regulator [Tersicoccus phoenicis]